MVERFAALADALAGASTAIEAAGEGQPAIGPERHPARPCTDDPDRSLLQLKSKRGLAPRRAGAGRADNQPQAA